MKMKMYEYSNIIYFLFARALSVDKWESTVILMKNDNENENKFEHQDKNESRNQIENENENKNRNENEN